MKPVRSLLACICIFILISGCQDLDLPQIRINLPGKETPTQVISTIEAKKGTPEPPQETASPERSSIPTPKAQGPIFYPDLMSISVSGETNMAPSPSQSHLSLPVAPVKSGMTAQLVASDPNGAWLLVLHQNTLGWIPTIYLGFGSGTLNVSVLYTEPEEPCNGYLGSITSLSQAWVSNISGSIKIQAISYLPSGSSKDGLWTAVVQETNDEIVSQVITTDLEQGGQINLLTISVDNISQGEHIVFYNSMNPEVPFQASFYSSDCSGTIAAVPPGTPGSNSIRPTQVPTIRMITIQVVSTSDQPVTPRITGIPSCPGAPKARLEQNEDAKVCTKKDNVYMRSGPGKNYDWITKLKSQSVLWVLDGPVCSGSAYWWKVRDRSDTVGWMMEGGDKNDPYYLCPN